MSGDALVGATGFVGGNLATQREFDLCVGSRTADILRGSDLDHVVFSAARAEKWKANADPEADARHVDDLIDLATSFTAGRVTLISTVDVYGTPAGVDEDSAVDTRGLHPYGANRYRLERAIAAAHEHVLVVRLPALFGPGLKKNVVFDLLHDNQVERIQPGSAFQYYDLRRLGDDLDRLWAAGVPLANLVTEPVPTTAVVHRVFGRLPLPSRDDLPRVHYDVRTRWGSVFGSSDTYIESGDRVLERMRDFVAAPGVPA